jgi:hypothetical protein
MNHINLTLIDAIYIASGLIGFLVSTHALPRYHYSLAAAGRVQNDSDRHDAVRINRGIVTREYVRLTIHILGLSVGIAAMFYVPPVRLFTSGYGHVFGIAVDAILLWANIGTTINTCLAWMEYCTVRKRGWFDREGMLGDLRARIRRVERVRPTGDAVISRDAWAHILIQLRSQDRKQKATDLRADATNVTVSDHEERIEVVEDTVEARILRAKRQKEEDEK